MTWNEVIKGITALQPKHMDAAMRLVKLLKKQGKIPPIKVSTNFDKQLILDFLYTGTATTVTVDQPGSIHVTKQHRRKI